MTTSTLTLTDFLLARIADDEGWAREMMTSDDQYFDPARVFAECKAKRAIVETHPLDYHGACPLCDHSCQTGGDTEPDTGPCDTLRALAAVYADHADFRDEWA